MNKNTAHVTFKKLPDVRFAVVALVSQHLWAHVVRSPCEGGRQVT